MGMSSSRPDLHDLAVRAEAEHHALAQSCEVRWQDELERRRRELADECSRVLVRIRVAAGA